MTDSGLFLESFLTRCSELKKQYSDHISSGTAESFSDYQKLCGTLEGLSIAEREIRELASRVGEDLGDMSDLD